MKIGFDNDKYIKLQSEHIRDRINRFDNKLYLELGGKLFDDHHASRVLPGFCPDSKIKMLRELSDKAEIVIAVSAIDIEKNKMRGDIGITYDEEVLRLIGAFKDMGLYVGSVVITQYSGQFNVDLLKRRLAANKYAYVLSLPHQGISIRHTAYRKRRGLRKKRIYRDHPSSCNCNGARTGKRQNGDLSVSALS